MAPVLSICVPSRNRQIYFQETIRALIANPRPDVEFVFADNSDEPEIMDGFIAHLPADPRIIYLRSGPRTYPMVENWERTVAASTGDWVTVIGDDDYLDADLVTVLSKVLKHAPDLEAFEWRRLSYAWPNPEKEKATNADITFGNCVYEVPKPLVMRRAFQWEDAEVSPVGGFSIYHAAVSRRLLLRIQDKCQGRFFEHPTVDFDNAFKVAWLGERFAFCERQFSVLGACPKSMSAALHDLAMLRQRHAEFMFDLGRNMDQDPELKDFPFSSLLGVSAAVMQVQISLKNSHKLTFKGWEENFTHACVNNCEEHLNREMFDTVVAGYREGFKLWKNGKYLKDFNPVFNEAAASAKDVYSGSLDGKTYIAMPLLQAETPKAFYDIVAAMLPLPDEVDATVRKPTIRHV